MANEIKKNIVSEYAGKVVETTFPAIAVAVGFPAAVVATPFVKGLVLGVIERCFNYNAKKTLSIRETMNLYKVSRVALQTFKELADKDGVVAWEMRMDPSNEEYALEVAEHVTMEAIRQSEQKKLEVIGRYYGKRFYQGPADWQDMHQIITMAGALTYRQMVLIRLICEGFEGISPEMFITNPSACVEINRMQDYGLWMKDMAMFKDDSSAKLQIKLLKPTRYAKMVYDALMLEKLSDDDIKRMVESLAISAEGEPAEGITKEDYEANTGFYYEEGSGGVKVGRKGSSLKDVATSPEDMAHVLKGKDLMKEATDNAHSGEYMQSIDSIMNALMEFKQCKADVLYQSSIDDALKELISFFELCQNKGGLRVLDGKKNDYEFVLGDLRSEHLAKCQKYLRKSEEKDKGYDRELYDKEIDAIFKN